MGVKIHEKVDLAFIVRGGRLQKSVDQLTQQREGEMKVIVERLVDARVQELIAQKVDAGITAKIGTQQEIEEIFQSAIKDQFAAVEEQKKQVAEAERQKQREEWDKRQQERTEQRLAELAKTLNLNDGQKEQIKVAQADMRTQMRALFESSRQEGGGPPDFDKMRQTMEALRAQHISQMQAIMSTEQLEAYQKQIDGMMHLHGPGGGRGGDRGGGRGGDRGGPGGNRGTNAPQQ